MVMVKEGFRVVHYPSRDQEQEREEEEERARERRGGGHDNFFTDSPCAFRLRANINNPQRADYFNAAAGWLTKLSSQKLPVLGVLQLSAKRVVMKSQAILTPRWAINAHSIVYVTKGRGRVQVANNEGRLVHDGELRQGQLLVVPQNFVAVAKAEEEGIEWVSFETDGNPVHSPLTGQLSVFRGLPVDVIANAYQLPREDAFKLKYGIIDLFAPDSSEQQTGGPFLAAQ